MADTVTISTVSARHASWALDAVLRRKRKYLINIIAENDPDNLSEIVDIEDDIAFYEAAYNEIREQL